MKKRTKIIIGILVLLIAVRIALPFIVTNYVNNILQDIDGYEGSIEGVGMHLYRGAYQIHEINLFSVEKDIKTPFLSVETIDISIEWAALLKGAIVGEIVLEAPKLNFVKGADKEVQTGKENDWTKTITDLLPLQINRFEIANGEITYLDEYSNPKVNLYFKQLNAVATNLNNAEDSDVKLPSRITANSKSIGDGEFTAEMDINILKKIPDFNMKISFENVDIPALNDFFQAYANIDAESGTFSFYTELALIDKQLDGYFKPLIEDLKILDWKEEEESFWDKTWEAVVGLAGNALENPKKKQIGTKIPISGELDDTSIGTWTAIFTLLKNAYYKPLQGEFDKTIQVEKDNIVNKDKKKGKKKK